MNRRQNHPGVTRDNGHSDRTPRARYRRPVAHQLMIVAILGTLGLWPGHALAGANETPGQHQQPHSFSYYSANLGQFGAEDLTIFYREVVGRQHYGDSGGYTDLKSWDLTTGSATVENFLKLCSSGGDDVILVTAHGTRAPVGTIVEQYPFSAAGRAARDASLNHWSAQYGPQYFAPSNPPGNLYGIIVLQAFYDDFLRTSQAFAWWASCHSSLLNMTGGGQARCFIGYNTVVTTRKCACDEIHVLTRMNGDQGQGNRPLGQAIDRTNIQCRDNQNFGLLIAQGRLNTVLSPAVIDIVPTGTVCAPTPGYVQFDCTMDQFIAPDLIVRASGEGILNDHAWAADDRITFQVVPTDPTPAIEYRVVESLALSFGDHARLDGNRNPNPSNARGPNRDDFLWTTTCPGGNRLAVTDPIPAGSPGRPAAGRGVDVSTPVFNQYSFERGVTLILTSPLLNDPESRDIVIPGDSTEDAIWNMVIPEGAAPGQIYPVDLEVIDEGGSLHASRQIQVAEPILAQFAGAEILTLGPGATREIEIVLVNESTVGQTILFSDLSSLDGWSTAPSVPLVDPDFEPGEIETISWTCTVPDVPPGTPAFFQLLLDTPSGPLAYDLEAVVGLDVEVTLVRQEAIAPGNPAAVHEFTIQCGQFHDLQWFGTDSNGFPLQVPPVVPCDPILGASLEVLQGIPNDPNLIGETGTIFLFAESLVNPALFRMYTFPYVIGQPVRMIDVQIAQPIFTGNAVPRNFTIDVVLENMTGEQVEIGLIDDGSELALGPIQPVILLPRATGVASLPLLLPPATPAGNYQFALQGLIVNHPATLPFGFEATVNEPVIVDLVLRGTSGSPGTDLPIRAAIRNVRDDHAVAGSFTWSDTGGWLGAPLAGNYSLAPGEADTLELLLAIPFEAQPSDTNLVSIDLVVPYDADGDDGSGSSGARGTGNAGISHAEIRVIIEPDLTDVPEEIGEDSGPAVGLSQLAPNPFQPSLAIRFQIAEAGEAEISVHDVSGRRVTVLASRHFDAGSHAIAWDGRTDAGRAQAGVYFIRLSTTGGEWTKKAVLLK